MAKKAMVERERKRQRMVERHGKTRQEMKDILANRDITIEERFKITLKLAKMPRNSSPVRLHNRCQVTGRPKGYYRKLKVSRIALRELGGSGQVPGMIKSSW